ncbi:MAG: hypothetical protein PHG13_00945 [Candidatus Pacebacteria bacterium]|nr:hypothetical protein [Candidatus Paceibacterota bacterium]MDD5721959.1 hypothetical protein [Candidatus Paceibacterota bacterium]
MLKNHLERDILRNRPYFGGLESDQVRSVFELNNYNWGRNILSFNVFSGVSGLYKIISHPFKGKNDSWYMFLEELGPSLRKQDVRIRLDRFSVVCYPDLQWEKEWCLIKTDIKSFKELKKLKINTKDYLPRYY